MNQSKFYVGCKIKDMSTKYYSIFLVFISKIGILIQNDLIANIGNTYSNYLRDQSITINKNFFNLR